MRGGRDRSEVFAAVTSATANLARSMRRLLASLTPPVGTAGELVSVLGIDQPLACVIIRVANAGSAAEAVEYLPTLNQVRRVIDAAAARTSAKSLADEARNAFVEFETLALDLGGDQRGFESLVSELSEQGVRRVEMQHRRQTYRGNAHLWGVNARAMMMLCVLNQSTVGGKFDMAAVLGLVGAVVRRPSRPIALSSRTRVPGQDRGAPVVRPPEPSERLQLLTEFSTIDPSAVVDLEGLGSGHAGVQGIELQHFAFRPHEAETLYLLRQAPQCLTIADAPYFSIAPFVSWPTELMHIDLAVPAGVSLPASARAAMFCNRDDPRGAQTFEQVDAVPLAETVAVDLDASEIRPAQELPRLPELFASVLQSQGWQGTRFDFYRLRVPFPVLHSVLRMMVDSRG
jgi:hypothetical protein